MERTSFADMECPIARTLEVVGEWWTLVVVRDAFLGVRRFQDFQARLGIAPNTLTRRLEALCAHGILEKRRYEERPPRDEYTLTEKGRDLLPLLLSLATYGNRWLAGDEGASIVPIDVATGAEVDPVLVDRRTARPLRAGVVALRAGPAASERLRAALDPPRVLGERSHRRSARAAR